MRNSPGRPRRLANTAQAEVRNGYEGEQWARSQERRDSINDGFNHPLLEAAAISETDCVPDIDCGAGRTTRLAAQRAGLGQALGLDLSGPMLEKARECVQNASTVALRDHEADGAVWLRSSSWLVTAVREPLRG